MSKTKHENLYQRNGVWWIRHNVNGKKVRRSLNTKSIREAKRLRNEIIGVRDASETTRAKFGLAAAPSAGAPVPTFGEVTKRYVTYRKATSKARASTLTLERQRIENWIVPTLGPRRITDITHDDVAMFLGRLRGEKAKRGQGKIGKAQLHRVYQALHRIFRFALRRRYARTNPCELERDERPAPSKPREVRLTDKESQQLLGKLVPESGLWRMVRVALETGLRWGEVAGLAWDDLDLSAEAPTYTVRRSFRGPPKNEASAATVPLLPSIAAALRSWRDESSAPWVFPTKHGEIPTRMPDGQRDRIFAAAAAAEITKHVTPHVFRHTFGSRVYEQTGDVKVTQRLMRHADVRTTLSIYVHDDRPLGDVVTTLKPIGVGTPLKLVG